MDALKKFTGGGSGGDSSSSKESSSTSSANQDNKDYLDKGLEAAEKKYGGEWGQNTEKNRETNEKITDGARNMFEKTTGKDVPDKVSN